MSTGYYIHKSSAEWEGVDRWENEGGRLGQNNDYILDSIGEDYRRHMDQVMPIGSVGKRDQIPYAMFLVSDKAKSMTGHSLGVDSERTLPQSVFAA